MLVIPDGCVGLPTLAALEQGISIVAVRGSKNLMRNDLSSLGFPEGKLVVVDNYLEAAGVLAAMRAGVDLASVKRPLAGTHVIPPLREEIAEEFGHVIRLRVR